MLKEYPKFERGEIENFFTKLSKKERDDIEEYIKYRQARGVSSKSGVQEIRRQIIHFRFIIKENINHFDLKKLRDFLALLTSTKKLSQHTKNEIKINLKNFLKWKFKDWSIKFSELEDIRLNSNFKNEEKINASNMLKKEDIEDIIKHEPKTYWKAFFMTQYEGGLRTIETRLLKWTDIKFDVDGDISEVSIFATKTKRARTIFVKEATFYLKKLKEEQENTDDKGVYVFHSKMDINKPIDRGKVSIWMRGLSKVSGKYCWNYLLRHSRATELYRLAKQGKVAKDTAISFMGHSEDMSKVYTHLDTKEIKEMLKNQVYKLEDLPEEKKHEIEIRLDNMEKDKEFTKRILILLAKQIMKDMGIKDRKEAEMIMKQMSKN